MAGIMTKRNDDTHAFDKLERRSGPFRFILSPALN